MANDTAYHRYSVIVHSRVEYLDSVIKERSEEWVSRVEMEGSGHAGMVPAG